jgi:TonB family protein
MRQLISCSLLAILALSAGANAQNEPVLKSHDVLVYPPIARAARVWGTVTVEFSITPSGQTDSVVATAGPAMLRGSAESFVKSWRFDWGSGNPASATKYQTTVDFKAINGVVDPRTDPGMVVNSDSFHHFEATILIGNIWLSDCPTGAGEDVPEALTKNDFVEVTRYACMGSCPDYSIRVQADGTVTWRGQSYVETVGMQGVRIDPIVARDLLEKFRTREFWGYCRDYTDNGLDGSSTSITVVMGGRTRKISDHDEAAPGALQNLLLDVDRVADSHRWRHGDPEKEPITRVGRDTYLPKPGVTSFMLEVARNKVDRVKELIASGADLEETDASGWSALMYAAGSSNSTALQLLLKAGADPNQRSLRGDTALMASCASGSWDDDLVRAGAEVNAQNKDGQTALMFLAARDEPDEIRDALKAGANAALKDVKGRTALDYLRLASCGKSPLYDRVTDGIYSYTKCTAFDADDLRKAKRLLEDAVRLKK